MSTSFPFACRRWAPAVVPLLAFYVQVIYASPGKIYTNTASASVYHQEGSMEYLYSFDFGEDLFDLEEDLFDFEFNAASGEFARFQQMH